MGEVTSIVAYEIYLFTSNKIHFVETSYYGSAPQKSVAASSPPSTSYTTWLKWLPVGQLAKNTNWH